MGGRNNLIQEVRDTMDEMLDIALSISYIGGCISTMNNNLCIPVYLYSDIQEELNEMDTDDIVNLKNTLREDYKEMRSYEMHLYMDIYGDYDEYDVE